MLSRIFLLSLFCIPYVKGQCQLRDEALASAVGRPCRKSCDPEENDCRGGKRCLCDHECGYSCINLNNQCGPPQIIDNLDQVHIFRTNSSGHLTQVRSELYQYNDIARYTCRPGYKKELPILPHYCHGRRGWTGRTNCSLSCKLYSALNVARENLTCGPSCTTDDDCSFSQQCVCDGYCGRSCVHPDIDCGEAPSAGEGSAIEYEGEGFGKVARYYCVRGFYPRFGDQTRKCTGGGRWSGRLLSCQRITCGDASQAVSQSGGRIAWRSSTQNEIGTRIRVECPPNHVLHGNGNRTCLPNGRWSGQHPSCNHVGELGEAHRCPHPGVPVDGRLLQDRNFSVGAVVQFRCNAGFVMIGDRTQECLYFLQWSGNGAPRCINPLHPFDFEQAFRRLRETKENIRTSFVEASPGNSFSDQPSSNINVFFVFDLADDNKDEQLERSITFAKDRVLQMSRFGLLRCSVILFASSVKILLQLDAYPEQILIENLQNILLDRTSLEQELGWRRNTTSMLTHLNRKLTSLDSYKRVPDNVVFLFINGKHSVGESPRFSSGLLKRNHESDTQIFVISYGSGLKFALAFPELKQMAVPSASFLPNPKVDQLKEYENKKIVKPSCGISGDLGDLKMPINVGKVAGGNAAEPGAWPWHAIISSKQNNIYWTFQRIKGGGSLINRQFVLTAAHLFDGNNKRRGWEQNIMVILGLSRLPQSQIEKLPEQTQAYDVERIIFHDNYLTYSYDYDVALIKLGHLHKQLGRSWHRTSLPSPIRLNKYIKPVCLPCLSECAKVQLNKQGLLNGDESVEQRCRIEENWLLQNANPLPVKSALFAVSGFGSNASHNVYERVQISQNLKQGIIKVMNNERCEEGRQAMIRQGLQNAIQFTPRMICGVSGKPETTDACKGDSGGPLIREIYDQQSGESCWVQTGIVSWGWGCGQTYGNGIQFPGFYTNVISVMDWVINQLQDNSGRCTRDIIFVEEGRICRKSCVSDDDCRGIRKRCICDDVCGFSCINPKAPCKVLPPILHGQIEGERTYGSNVTYSCDVGYELSGASTRKCRSDRTWSGVPPTCEPAAISTCTSPRDVVNGRKSHHGTQVVDTQVEYTCNRGYTFQGRTQKRVTMTCLDSGQWSDVGSLICVEMTCGPPREITNGRKSHHGTQVVDTQVEYTCNRGYTFQGRTQKRVTMTCLDSGQWSDVGSLVCVGVASCTLPSNLHSSRTQVPLGGVVTYSCRLGFNLQGHSADYMNVTCQSSGQWSSSAPICSGFGCAHNGGVCELPFVYRNTYYYACTTRDNVGRPWCSKTPTLVRSYGECRQCSVTPLFRIHDPNTIPSIKGSCGESSLTAFNFSQTYSLTNFPSNYDNNLDCLWTIRAASPKGRVEITLQALTMENCCDYIKIHDGPNLYSKSILRISGKVTTFYSFHSTFDVLTVLFHSDQSINYAGFQFTYRQHIYSQCGDELQATNRPQAFSTPGWPGNYTNNAFCLWTIRAPAGLQVKLDFSPVHTEKCCDYLLVRDGTHENSSSIINERGSFRILTPVISSEGVITVVFRSDAAGNGEGFRATYYTVPTSSSFVQRVNPVCKGRNLVAPNVGHGNFSLAPVAVTGATSFHCIWTISAPTGRQVRLWFSYMYLTTTNILIRDGRFDNSRKIGSLNGRPFFFTSFVSTGGVLRAEVISNPTVKANETFFAFYEIHQPGGDSRTSSCGGTFQATSALKYISTPNWPDYYTPNSTCEWTLNARPKHYIHLNFLGILTNRTTDFVQVFDGNSVIPLYNLRGIFNVRFIVTSSGRRLRIVFRSGPTRKHSGFRATFKESPKRLWRLYIL